MKNLLLLFLFAFLLQNCTPIWTTGIGQVTSIKPEKNESNEWDLIVMDAQYDSFLASEARPKSMYTEQYLKSKNTFLVQEWNSYYYSRAYSKVIESTIDYNPSEKYGLDFEYKLYQVFAMVNSRYGVPFNHLGQMDKRR